MSDVGVTAGMIPQGQAFGYTPATQDPTYNQTSHALVSGGGGLPSGGTPGQVVTNTAPGVGTWQNPASGLPSGGSVGQVVVNTGPGTGSWQTLGNHYAEYTYSFSVANTGEHTVTSGFSQVTDTDGFGTNINSTGQLVIPSGLGGPYVVLGQTFSPSIANFSTAMLQKNAGDIAGWRGVDSNTFNYGAGGTYTGLCAVGDAFTMLLGHAAGSSQTFTGRLSLVLIAPSTPAPVGTGLVPIAKTANYTAVGNRDWVIVDTTGGAVTISAPAGPSNNMIFAVTWQAGGFTPAISGNGNTILGSPTLGAIGNTIWLQFSTVANTWLTI